MGSRERTGCLRCCIAMHTEAGVDVGYSSAASTSGKLSHTRSGNMSENQELHKKDQAGECDRTRLINVSHRLNIRSFDYLGTLPQAGMTDGKPSRLRHSTNSSASHPTIIHLSLTLCRNTNNTPFDKGSSHSALHTLLSKSGTEGYPVIPKKGRALVAGCGRVSSPPISNSCFHLYGEG